MLGGFPKPTPYSHEVITPNPFIPESTLMGLLGVPRASHGHFPCSLISAALLETSPLCGQTGSFTHRWGPRRRPAHMQARRQRRPRQTPTMMPVTECTSKESGGGEGGNRTDGGRERTQGS